MQNNNSDATQPFFDRLNNLIVEECNLWKKRKKTQEDRDAIKANVKKQRAIRDEIFALESDYRANYSSPLSEILPNRSREEHLVAESVLSDMVEYPYKSDKVKAFIAGGVNDSEIFQLMDLTRENNVTMSYINSIRTKLAE